LRTDGYKVWLCPSKADESHQLVSYTDDFDSAEHVAAWQEAKRAAMTMDVPELLEGVLDFFGRFAAWFKDTPGSSDGAATEETADGQTE
jgi:hypothetical protein